MDFHVVRYHETRTVVWVGRTSKEVMCRETNYHCTVTPALRNADRPSRVALAVALAVVVLASAAVVTVSAHTNEVSADSQVATNGTVQAETAFVLTDSWLVVHHDADGSIGEPIGHTLVRSGGLQTDVQVPIDESVWANWTETRQVHLVLHNDDGDGQFDPDEDPILTTGSEPAATDLTVAKGSESAYVSAEQFDVVETNGSVRVRQAVSPSAGFLVLTAPDGQVFGQTDVAAGTTQNVTVDIDETLYRQQPAEFDLTVSLYADDGDGQFGDSDDPVRAGEDAVSTTITMQRTDDRTPAPGETTSPDETDGTNGTEGTSTPDSEESDDHEHSDGDSHEHSDGAEDHEHGDDGQNGSSETEGDDSTAAATATDSGDSSQSTTAPDDSDGETPGGGGPGFGVFAVLGSVLVVVWHLVVRRK